MRPTQVIDPRTVAKVHFVPQGGERQAAEGVGVPLEILPQLYGGKAADGAVPVPNIPGEPNVATLLKE